MKRRVIIYKTQKEKEMFYKAFLKRLYFQQSIQKECLMQQRRLGYDKLPKDKKTMPGFYAFSAF